MNRIDCGLPSAILVLLVFASSILITAVFVSEMSRLVLGT